VWAVAVAAGCWLLAGGSHSHSPSHPHSHSALRPATALPAPRLRSPSAFRRANEMAGHPTTPRCTAICCPPAISAMAMTLMTQAPSAPRAVLCPLALAPAASGPRATQFGSTVYYLACRISSKGNQKCGTRSKREGGTYFPPPSVLLRPPPCRSPPLPTPHLRGC
jgi:hypothetical protein